MAKAWIAGISSLLLPGLGFIYARHDRWAYLGLLLLILPTLILGWTQWIFKPFGVITYLFLNIVIYLSLATLSALAAFRKLRAPEKIPWLRIIIYLITFLVFMNSGTKHFIREDIAGFNIYRQSSVSMLPIIKQGDLLLVDTGFYRHAPVKPGDIVTFYPPENQSYKSNTIWIKRVVAQKNDHIAIAEDKLIVNGEELKDTIFHGVGPSFSDYVLDQNEVFVLGDNRLNSNDSRFWGPLNLARIHGRVVSVVLSEGRLVSKSLIH